MFSGSPPPAGGWGGLSAKPWGAASPAAGVSSYLLPLRLGRFTPRGPVTHSHLQKPGLEGSLGTDAADPGGLLDASPFQETCSAPLGWTPHLGGMKAGL